MNPIHSIVAAAALGALALSMPAAFAQSAHGHDHMGMNAHEAPASVSGDGEVRKIDLESAKVTVKHEASQDMNMPGMTMVYRVQPASMLTKVKVGDKVRFRIATVDGKMTITQMQAVH